MPSIDGYKPINLSTASNVQTNNNTNKTDNANAANAGIASSAASEDENQVFEPESVAETEAPSAVDKVKKQNEEAQSKYREQVQKCKEQIQQCYEQISQINMQQSSLLSNTVNQDKGISDVMSGYNELFQQKTKLYTNIQQLLLNIQSLEEAMVETQNQTEEAIKELQALQDQYNSLSSSYNDPEGSLANITALDTNSDVGSLSAQMGLSYVGVINNDAQGNAEFSPGGASQHWCADFATAITKRAYQAKGMTVPSGFGSSSVEGLRSWGASNGRYSRTADMGSSKGSYIAQNIKPGDIMIQQENNAGHTGIVTKVYPDGSFDTVEGNSSDAVKKRHYDANSDKLSGFVKMS